MRQGPGLQRSKPAEWAGQLRWGTPAGNGGLEPYIRTPALGFMVVDYFLDDPHCKTVRGCKIIRNVDR